MDGSIMPFHNYTHLHMLFWKPKISPEASDFKSILPTHYTVLPFLIRKMGVIKYLFHSAYGPVSHKCIKICNKFNPDLVSLPQKYKITELLRKTTTKKKLTKDTNIKHKSTKSSVNDRRRNKNDKYTMVTSLQRWSEIILSLPVCVTLW